MAITYSTPGQYTLGGISAPRTGVSESFRAGVQANLGRQDAKQTMRQREQQMALAQSEEARRAQLFELGLEDRRRAIAQQAAAAARAAQARQAASAFRAGLRPPAGATTPTGTPITPAPPPPNTVTVPTGVVPGAAPSAPSAPAAPSAAAPTVTPSAPLTGGGGSGMVTGGVNDRAGGAGDDMLGLQLQGADPRRAEAESFGAGVRGAVGGVLDRAAGAVSAAGSGLYGLGTDVLGAGAAVVGAPGVAAGLERQSDIAYNIALTNLRQGLSATSGVSAEDLDMEPTEFRAAVRQAEEAAAAEGVPSSPKAAAAEAPTSPEEAAPLTRPSYGGLQLDFGTPVQLSFGETEGEASKMYVAAPERIFQDADLVERQRQRLQLLANYYQQTNDLQGFIGVQNQLDELAVEQRYLDGMTAIVGIQQENFGPVQSLLQRRYPGRQVEVRPYTDGTAEIFLDGQSEARLPWDDLATGLRGSYDRGFIEQQQAVADRALEQANFAFEQSAEQQAIAQREIAVNAAEAANTSPDITWQRDTAGVGYATYVTPQGGVVQLVSVPEYPFTGAEGNAQPGPAILMLMPDGQYSQPVYIAPDGSVRAAQ